MNKQLLIQVMARRKTVSDDDLLDRLLPVLTAHGPDGLTLALAGAAAGFSAATLLQRFRSREAMIEAILLRAWDRLDATTAAADNAAPDGPEGAIALLGELMPMGSVDTAMTDGLLLLREDFRNPMLRQRGAAWGERLATALGRRLAPDPVEGKRLGWQMAQVWQGALIWWAFTREGDAAAYVSGALRAWCRSTAGLRRGPH